ncbi:MAG TPA: hypothetical protein VN451_06540, partial [Chitinophagaceae bacterium]|nr:hypothetical protein [Chitinophagaceae bacterium]
VHRNDTLRFIMDLSKYYDFRKILLKGEKKFAASFTLLMPCVSYSYKQDFEVDPQDNVLKPIYYQLSLPKKQDLDSMRVHFEIP